MIQIHRDCLRFVNVISKNAPWVRFMSEKHELDGLFDSFSGDLSNNCFGFNQALQKIRDDGEYIEFLALLPRIKIRTHLACEHCDGTGKSLDEWREGEECLRCDGSGIKHVYDWRSAFAVTSSLSLLFMILDFSEETSAKEYQHVVVSMCADHGQHGSSIDGCFGADFLDYICSNQSELDMIILKEVTEAMIVAQEHMFGSDTYARGTTRSESDNGSVGLTVPGDACGINTGCYDRKIGEGREFSCHNVDSQLQSLTLLAGIASLVGQIGFYVSAKEDMAVKV